MLPSTPLDAAALFQSFFPNVDINQLLVQATLLQQKSGVSPVPTPLNPAVHGVNLASIASGTKHAGYCPRETVIAPPLLPPGYYAPAVISASPEPVQEDLLEEEQSTRPGTPEEMEEEEPFHFEMGRIPTSHYFPTHFMKGTVISLSNGYQKTVDQLCSDDFLMAAGMTNDVTIEACAILEICKSNDLTKVSFMVASHGQENNLEVQNEHPFFTLGKGWCSADPKGTRKIYGLKADYLKVGDICIALVMNEDKARQHGPSFTLPEAIFQVESMLQKSDIRNELEIESGRRSAPPLGYRPAARLRSWSDSTKFPIYSD